MSEMVERVARAMAEKNRGCDLWDEISDDSDTDYVGRNDYRDMARAAIEAMRSMPAESSVIRLTGAITVQMTLDRGENQSAALVDAWEAMIDAVLK